MKKVLFATISCGLVAAISAAPLTALAEEAPAPSGYPEINDTVEFSDLTDFAVASEKLAVFAQGDAQSGYSLMHWDDEVLTAYPLSSAVTDLDYDGTSGKFYYSLDGGTTSYILPESPEGLPGDRATHDYSAPYGFLDTNIFAGYHYYYDPSDSVFTVLEENGSKTTKLEGFNKAKMYGNKLYAICEDSLYKVEGTSTEKINFTYVNYSELINISAEGVAQKLKEFSESPKYINIKLGSMVTEIDLNLINDSTSVIPVSNPKDSTTKDISGSALLLFRSSNLLIFAKSGKAYMTAENSAVSMPGSDALKPVEGTATVNVPGGEYAYSLPYMCGATRLFALNMGDEVELLGEVFDGNPEFGYYLIKTAEGKQGYVLAKFLNDFNVKDGDASTLPEKNPKKDDYTKTVILVLVVVLLVLVAVVYLTRLGTNGKRKKTAKDKTEEDAASKDEKAEENKK